MAHRRRMAHHPETPLPRPLLTAVVGCIAGHLGEAGASLVELMTKSRHRNPRTPLLQTVTGSHARHHQPHRPRPKPPTTSVRIPADQALSELRCFLRHYYRNPELTRGLSNCQSFCPIAPTACPVLAGKPPRDSGPTNARALSSAQVRPPHSQNDDGFRPGLRGGQHQRHNGRKGPGSAVVGQDHWHADPTAPRPGHWTNTWSYWTTSVSLHMSYAIGSEALPEHLR